MKRTTSTLLTLLTFTIAQGQFAIIHDADGYTNVRDSASINAPVKARLHNGEVFTYTYTTHGWTTVYYKPSEHSDIGYFTGFIHADRLIPLETLPHIPKTGRTQTSNKLTLHNDSLTAELLRSPKLKLSGLSLTINGKPVAIPTAAWNDLQDVNLTYINIYFDRATGFFYLVIPSSGDGEGAYQLAWVFKDGHYLRRYTDGF